MLLFKIVYTLYFIIHFTLLWSCFCKFLIIIFTYFNLQFCSKLVLFYINYSWLSTLELVLLLHGADLIIFDCSYIHWINFCALILEIIIKVPVELCKLLSLKQRY
jgi:hypothetical protein